MKVSTTINFCSSGTVSAGRGRSGGRGRGRIRGPTLREALQPTNKKSETGEDGSTPDVSFKPSPFLKHIIDSIRVSMPYT